MKRAWIRLVAALPLADTTLLITDARLEVRRGKVRAGLLRELNELLKLHPLAMACIQARTTQTGFRLSFHGIPQELHQRFRNVWSANWK